MTTTTATTALRVKLATLRKGDATTGIAILDIIRHESIETGKPGYLVIAKQQVRLRKFIQSIVPLMATDASDPDIFDAIVATVIIGLWSDSFELVFSKDISGEYSDFGESENAGGYRVDSCMSSEHGPNFMAWLDNRDNVSIALLYDGRNVAARCLVWTGIDGNQYHDRIYESNQNTPQFLILQNKLNNQGIYSAYYHARNDKINYDVCVRIEGYPPSGFPYMDCVKYMHCDGSDVFYLTNRKTSKTRRILINTAGGSLVTTRAVRRASLV